MVFNLLHCMYISGSILIIKTTKCHGASYSCHLCTFHCIMCIFRGPVMSDSTLLHSADASHHNSRTQEMTVTHGKRKDPHKIWRTGLTYGGDNYGTPGPFSNSALPPPLYCMVWVTSCYVWTPLTNCFHLLHLTCLAVHRQPTASLSNWLHHYRDKSFPTSVSETPIRLNI